MRDQGERINIANRIERHTRYLVVAMGLTVVIASVDLITGWLTADRRFDIAILVAGAMGVGGIASLRQLAQQMREGLPPRPTKRSLMLSVSSVAAALVLTGVIGYLIGGWALAMILPSVTTLLVAASAAFGLWRARRVVGP